MEKEEYTIFNKIKDFELTEPLRADFTIEDDIYCLECGFFNVVACGETKEQTKSNFEDEFLSVRNDFLQTKDEDFCSKALALKNKFKVCFK